MVFNWFRRKFTDGSETAADPVPPEPETPVVTAPGVAEEAAVAPSESSLPPEAPPAKETTNQDYLNWAKAAYRKIQERQGLVSPIPGSPTTETSAAEGSEAELTEPALAAQPTPEPVVADAAETTPQAVPAEAIPAEVAETEVAELTVAPELTVDATSAETPSTVIPAVETPAVETQPEKPVAPQTPEPLPFWAQAEAERQVRMERLQAAAVSTIAPEVSPLPLQASPQSPETTPVSEVATAPLESPPPTPDESTLDEGFLWSAEVLAAQGRQPEEISLEEINWLQKLRRGLGKTRRGLVNQLKAVVGRGPLGQDAVSEIESLLLQADVGVEATDTIIQALQQKLRQEAVAPDAAIAYLKEILREILDRPFSAGYAPTFVPEKQRLNIWLLTGVNGVGKTTTIGKIAHVAVASGYKCLIGAADTFRAAAVEQVKIWGQRSQVEVIANPGKNTDPAAVVFDAIAAAQSRNVELLLVDTAGRLQNKQNLMEELRKIRKIVDKKAPGAVVESLLVLDATLGQNGLRQAQVFAEAAQLSGVVITKLDGTAKGGVALAVVQQLGLPIRFIGAGEGIEDLRPFSSYEFVEALLSDELPG